MLHPDCIQTEPTSKSIRPIASTIGSLDEQAGLLAEALSFLEEKLNPVLGPVGPTAVHDKEARDLSGSSDVVRQLENILTEVIDCRTRVQELSRRLEV